MFGRSCKSRSIPCCSINGPARRIKYLISLQILSEYFEIVTVHGYSSMMACL